MQLWLLISLVASVLSILAYIAFHQDSERHEAYSPGWAQDTGAADAASVSIGETSKYSDFSWSVVALKVLSPEEL